MLISLDDSISAPIATGDGESVTALENILAAVFNGFHCARGSLSLLAQLAASPDISRRSKAVLVHLRNEYVQRDAFLQSFETQVIVVDSDVPEIQRNASTWRVPLRLFSHTNVDQAIVLAENLRDAEIYRVTGEHYLVANKLRGTKTAAVTRGGGGATTPQEFQSIADQRVKVCLCITDSDRLYPGAEPSHTSKQCASIAEGPALVRHHCISVRELENLFARSVLERALEPPLHVRIERLFSLVEVFPEIADHISIRNGLKLQWVLELPLGTPRAAYWRDVVNKLTTAGLMDFDCFELPPKFRLPGGGV